MSSRPVTMGRARSRTDCRSAEAPRSTARRSLFATPHVWPYFTLSAEREAAIRAAFDRMRPYATVELRLGFELTPAVALLDEDPHRYALEGTDCVLHGSALLGAA